jgi:hypothetical protein
LQGEEIKYKATPPRPSWGAKPDQISDWAATPNPNPKGTKPLSHPSDQVLFMPRHAHAIMRAYQSITALLPVKVGHILVLQFRVLSDQGGTFLPYDTRILPEAVLDKRVDVLGLPLFVIENEVIAGNP